MRKLMAIVLAGLMAASCSDDADTPSGGAPRGAGPTETKTASLGDRVELASGDTVQVHSYASDIAASNPFSEAQPGKSFSAIDVEACAGRQRSDGGVVNPFQFTLLMPDGSRVQTSIPVKDPGLNVVPLDPGTCTRGFVTYETTIGARPTVVVWETTGIDVRWTVPRS